MSNKIEYNIGDKVKFKWNGSHWRDTREYVVEGEIVDKYPYGVPSPNGSLPTYYDIKTDDSRKALMGKNDLEAMWVAIRVPESFIIEKL